MKDGFINLIKLLSKNNVRDLQTEAYDTIIKDIIINNKTGNDKIYDLDGYDSESLMPSKIIPGNIYIMLYNAKTPTIYTTSDNKTVLFTDSEPIILVTSTNGKNIRGINLNLCTPALRTLILNIFYNLDPHFFEDDAEKMALNTHAALSKNILTFLHKGNAEDVINDYLKHMYNIDSYKILFRNYNIDNIKRMRMIEPWQWRHLPFLVYSGTIKKDILNIIHQITGIAKIKV